MQFLLYQVVDPQTYKEQVTVKYYVTQQKPTQSICDFTTYLRGWECHFTMSLPEEHWREHFWASLCEDLQLELAYYQYNESGTFEGFVLYIQGVEDQIKAVKDQ